LVSSVVERVAGFVGIAISFVIRADVEIRIIVYIAARLC